MKRATFKLFHEHLTGAGCHRDAVDEMFAVFSKPKSKQEMVAAPIVVAAYDYYFSVFKRIKNGSINILAASTVLTGIVIFVSEVAYSKVNNECKALRIATRKRRCRSYFCSRVMSFKLYVNAFQLSVTGNIQVSLYRDPADVHRITARSGIRDEILDAVFERPQGELTKGQSFCAHGIRLCVNSIENTLILTSPACLGKRVF